MRRRSRTSERSSPSVGPSRRRHGPAMREEIEHRRFVEGIIEFLEIELATLEEMGFRYDRSEEYVANNGETRLLDRFDIEGLPRHFARHRAFGTLLLVAPVPEEGLEQQCLALNEVLAGVTGLYGAASLLPGAIGIGLRLVAAELRQVRQATELALGQLRLLLPAS